MRRCNGTARCPSRDGLAGRWLNPTRLAGHDALLRHARETAANALLYSFRWKAVREAFCFLAAGAVA